MKITGWKEVPSSGKRYLGLCLWLTGGEVRVGRQMWRWRLDAGRELCFLLRRHEPITIIDKADIEDIWQEPYGLSVRGRITKQHKECYRCKKVF